MGIKIKYTSESSFACSEYGGDLHGSVGEGASLVEEYSLYACTLDSLLRLSPIDPFLAEAYQAKGVGQIEEDRQDGRETVGDEL